MKVALSASFWQNQKVQELLGTCDLIFTTNILAYENLKELFPDKVFIMPNACTETILTVKSWFPNAEFITYSEVFNLDRGR